MNRGTVRLRLLSAGDMAAIRYWPSYDGEMAPMDYALRAGGWPDEFGADPRATLYAVEEGGELVGFTLLAESGVGEAEFRIALRVDRTGRGLGKEAARQTLRIAFGERGVLRIHLIVRIYNARGRTLYQRLGFVDRGACRLPICGAPVDFRRMEIDRAEWLRREQAQA